MHAAHHDYPALSRLRFSPRVRTTSYWRTRHLAGFTSSTHPAAPGPGSRSATDGALPRQPGAENRADEVDTERTASPEQHGWNPFSGETHFAPPTPSSALPPRQLLLRTFLMAAIFIIGITAGLYAARWMTRPAMVAPVDTVRKTAPAATVTDNAGQDGRRHAARGISPGELPYDGAPPAGDETASQLSAAPAATTAESYSGASAPEDDAEQTGSTSLSEVPAGEAQGATADESPNAAVTQSRRTVPGEAARKEAVQKGTAQKRAAGKAADAEKRQERNAKAAAKDREIERIKKQADEELRRKLESRAGDKKASGSKLTAGSRDGRHAATARETRVKQTLARCERNSNLFRREQCKWRVCGDSWGKYGCPSYAKPASFY